MRLVEHDGDLLHWYYDQGLVPGAKLTVLDVQPAAGLLTVKLGAGKSASEQLIADKAARGLIVRVASSVAAQRSRKPSVRLGDSSPAPSIARTRAR